jgi:PDZ and LIM domain protein 5/6/7
MNRLLATIFFKSAVLQFRSSYKQVNEGSLAEEYGMLKGDVIVRINEAPTSNLTHFEAHELLVHAGNSFVLGVLR